MPRVDTNRNIVAAIVYLPFLAFIISLVVYFVEKDDKFIRFHALQSFVISVVYYLIVILLGSVPFAGGAMSALVVFVAMLIWIISMVRAYQGQVFKWPVVGNWAEKQVNRQ